MLDFGAIESLRHQRDPTKILDTIQGNLPEDEITDMILEENESLEESKCHELIQSDDSKGEIPQKKAKKQFLLVNGHCSSGQIMRPSEWKNDMSPDERDSQESADTEMAAVV